MLHRNKSFVWGALSLFGGAFYLARIYQYIHILPSMLDEGTYLYKGLLFIEGVYKPFQAYGPWTNKSPWLFYLFGLVQKLFGPGLATGRYFALALAMLLAVSLWASLRKVTSPFWASVAVWILALSPLTGVVYAYAASQIVVAAFLAVALACLLGQKRSLMALYCSTFWFAILSLMRVHMILLGLFALIYIYRYYGKKIFGRMAVLWGTLILLGYGLFWPEMGRLWQGLLPSTLARLLPDKIPSLGDATSVWAAATQNISVLSRLNAVAVALVSEIFIVFGQIFGSLYLLNTWRQVKNTPEDLDKRWVLDWLTTFIPAYFVFYGIFVWNTFANNYCVDCLKFYTRFITPLGLVNLVLLLFTLKPARKLWLDSIAVLGALVAGALTGFSVWEILGKQALYFPVPKIWDGKLWETVTLWTILESKLQLSYNQARLFSPILLGIFFSSILVVALLILYKIRCFRFKVSYGYSLFISTLILTTVFVAATYQEQRACEPGFDVLASEKRVGIALDESIIKDGALVYWAGGQSITPLLYVEDIQTFPQQYNNIYAKYLGGDTETLLKYGFYNEESDENWQHIADYFVISNENISHFKSLIAGASLIEIPIPSDALGCSGKAQVRLFARENAK